MPLRGFNFNDEVFKKPSRSRQNLSHSVKTTFDAGKLIPLTWFEAYPGESFKIDVGAMVRTQALLTPMYEDQKINIRVFKIPYRILASYDDYSRAITGGESGTAHINFPFFQSHTENMTTGSLYDYLGLPLPIDYSGATPSWEGTSYASIVEHDAFPFLAYHRIYNDAYRNEETEKNAPDTYSDGQPGFGCPFSWLEGKDPHVNYLKDYAGNNLYKIDELHTVGWPRDYFTSALKNTQRGTQVAIPLVPGDIPVKGKFVAKANGQIYSSGAVTTTGGNVGLDVTSPNSVGTFRETSSGRYLEARGAAGDLHISMEDITGIGAIALRTAMNVQALMEKWNVSGYRLDEQDFAIFGVSGDMRKTKAVCCGGAQLPINVQEVTQTSSTASQLTPLATLAGKGSANGKSGLATVHCGERSIIMIVASVTPQVGQASQGLERKWTNRTYLDLYWPDLQTIGEQEIKNQEVFFDFNGGYLNPANSATWAYQQRYSQLKYMPDVVRGDFRTSLLYWHQARVYSSLPAFNDNYIKCNPSDRIFAVQSGLTNQHYVAWFYFKIKAIRPMSKYIFSKIW